MARPYRTLSGGVSSFELTGGNSWAGITRNPHARNGQWGENLFRTPRGVWIIGRWQDLPGDYSGPTSRGLPFWEVTPEQAAEWFAENHHPEMPDVLCADLDRRQPPALPIDAPPAPGPVASGESLARPSRSPSLSQVRELIDSIGEYFRTVACSVWPTCMWKQEDHVFPWFARLADAINAVRPVADSCPGWPDRVRLALPEVITTFDKVAADWGWEDLAKPEPERTALQNARLAWFAETVERPRYEAALSIQAGWRCMADHDPAIDALAEEAKVKGCFVTMTPAEGESRFPEADKAYWLTCRLGREFPVVPDDLSSKFSAGHGLLKSALEEAKRRDRPPAPPTSLLSPTDPPPALPLQTVPTTRADAETGVPTDRGLPPASRVDPVAVLRKSGARTRAALVEFMKDRDSATTDEIAHHVHGDDQTTEKAISKNVQRTNESLIEMGFPLRFSLSSGLVFKEKQPE